MSPAHRSQSLRVRRSDRSPNFVRTFMTGLKTLLIAIVALLFLAITIGAYFLHTKLVQFRNSQIVFINDNLDGKENLISFVKMADQTTQVATFDEELPVKVAKHGQYPLRSVYPLLRQEKYSHHQIAALYAFIFGQKVDAVIALPAGESNDLKTQLWQGVKAGTVPLTDAMAIWWLFGTLPTSDEAHHVSSWSDWGPLREKKFNVSLRPNCSLAIVNTTSQNGLAQAFNTVLEAEGTEVIRVRSVVDTQSQTKLYQVDESCSPVVALIQQISPVTLAPETSQLPESEYRAKLLLLIGEDLAEINPQLSW